MILYIFISLFLVLIIWILFAPIILRVDTNSTYYRIALPGVLTARVVPTEKLFYIRVWLFFIPFRVNPFKSRKRKKENEKKASVGRKKRNINTKTLLKRLSNTCKVKMLKMNIDTDDFILNAWLIPAFSTINNRDNILMQVNFEGVQYINLDVRARLSTILWLLIKMKY